MVFFLFHYGTVLSVMHPTGLNTAGVICVN